MSNDRYERIRDALAMGPTPGPWVHDGDGVTADDEDVAVAMCCPSDAEAAFIAACDPDTIRELLSERDALAAALEAAREDAERYRWLREHDDRNLWEFKGAYHDIAELKRGKDLDVAIDQARGKAGQEVES